MSTASSKFRLSEDQVDCESEVELISLITEKLPHYKLRADYSVRFSGYQHSDFNRAEQVQEDITELTNEQIHQTLEYFILCGLRVHKMTETYEDCAALTLLVQEQRSHLDLAANIGLNLVEKNTQLEQRVQILEEQLDASKETMKQMRHQLSLKDDLLRMFHSEIEDSEDQSTSQSEPSDSVFLLDKVNVRQLESKLNRLEEENVKLRDQQQNINSHTDLLESKETQLVNDCVSHILESTKTIDRLSVELNKKTNEYLNQHEEISRLLTSKIDLENKTHNLLSENDNLITLLRDHQTKEFTLTKELADMRDRYDECINLLNEKQDDIRRLKKKIERESMRQAQCYNSSSPEPDVARSIAFELEQSSRRGAEEQNHSRTMRIMEQARSLNTIWVDGDDTSSSGFTEDLGSSILNMDTEMSAPEQLSGNFLLRRSIQDDCERRRLLRHHGPGSKGDTHSSSGTITPRCPSTFTDSQYISEAMHHRQNSCNGLSSLNTNIISRNDSPTFSNNMLRFPDKLQLIKPIEGSQTLRAWQNLATPSLTKSLFEDQPQGVCFRGQQFSVNSSESSPNSDISQDRNGQMELNLSDVEDTDCGKPSPVVRAQEQESHCNTYTYSSSRIVHPSSLVTCPSVHSMSPSPSLQSQAGVVYAAHRNGSVSSHESTPVNDDAYQQRSWLDRFTVGSIMTSILGYSRPPASVTFASASPRGAMTVLGTGSVSSVSETSIIGRLTNLPPLARRKPPQQRQSGLNLLTSLAPSNVIKTAIYRAGSGDSEHIDEGPSLVD